MANTTGNGAAAQGHQQSTGPGQRQGSAHDSPPARARVPNDKRLSGMNGHGVAHVAGAIGMLGTPRPVAAFAESSPDADALQESTGVSLRAERGSQGSRQHASGK